MASPRTPLSPMNIDSPSRRNRLKSAFSPVWGRGNASSSPHVGASPKGDAHNHMVSPSTGVENSADVDEAGDHMTSPCRGMNTESPIKTFSSKGKQNTSPHNSPMRLFSSPKKPKSPHKNKTFSPVLDNLYNLLSPKQSPLKLNKKLFSPVTASPTKMSSPVKADRTLFSPILKDNSSNVTSPRSLHGTVSLGASDLHPIDTHRNTTPRQLSQPLFSPLITGYDARSEAAMSPQPTPICTPPPTVSMSSPVQNTNPVPVKPEQLLLSHTRRPHRPEPVFRTPMTYSPRMVGNKLRPSPCKFELWKEQLGLEDDGAASTSESESETERISSKFEHKKADSPCTATEYNALKRELDERSVQRDEMLYKIKSLKDKALQYKVRLDKEETSKRQQLMILKKSHETHIQEKEYMVHNLEDVIEEQKAKITELETELRGEDAGRSRGGVGKLAETIKQLQLSRADMRNQLLSAQAELEHNRQDYAENIAGYQDHIENLKLEKEELYVEIDRLKCFTKQDNSGGPYHTDTEKQVEKLLVENRALKNELADGGGGKVACQCQKEESQLIQVIEAENERLHSRVKTVQKELDDRINNFTEREFHYKTELMRLTTENQQIARQMRELRAEFISQQAREPEVVTKIKKVEVESEEAKICLRESQRLNRQLSDKIDLLQRTNCDMRDQLIVSRNKNADLERQVGQFTCDISELNNHMESEIGYMEQQKDEAISASRQEMENKIRLLEAGYDRMKAKLKYFGPLMSETIEAYLDIKDQCLQFPLMVRATMEHAQQKMTHAIAEVGDTNKDLARRYKREMKLRKKLNNELIEIKGNIRVFCRVRPRINEDGHGAGIHSVVTYDRDDDSLINVSNNNRVQSFELDKVFQESVSQAQVFEEVRGVVNSCIDGYNVCIFAYGQTGSGKTYTMEGPRHDPGINQRALEELFNEIRERDLDWFYTITVSAMEIYNEVLRDLFKSDPNYKLEIKMDGHGGLYVPGLTQVSVESVHDVNKVFDVAKQNRATAVTNMNEHSSRSHALLCVNVCGVKRSTNERVTSRLNLIDLAGSERVSKSGADGERLREAQNINKSLSSLGDVINALKKKNSHVPFRNSKLTYLLQDSLGGESKTLMIVQISPIEKNVAETLCSLNFALRVKHVELGMASRKVETVTDSETQPQFALRYPNSPLSPHHLKKTNSTSGLRSHSAQPTGRLASSHSATNIRGGVTMTPNRPAPQCYMTPQKSGFIIPSSLDRRSPVSKSLSSVFKPIRKK